MDVQERLRLWKEAQPQDGAPDAQEDEGEGITGQGEQGCEEEGESPIGQGSEGEGNTEQSASCRPVPSHWGTGAGTDRDTVNMLARAVRERWPIPQDLREDACRILGEIIRNSPDARAVAVACRTLGVYDGLNLQQEKRSDNQPQVKAHIHISMTPEEWVRAQQDLASRPLQLASTGQGAPQ